MFSVYNCLELFHIFDFVCLLTKYVHVRDKTCPKLHLKAPTQTCDEDKSFFFLSDCTLMIQVFICYLLSMNMIKNVFSTQQQWRFISWNNFILRLTMVRDIWNPVFHPVTVCVSLIALKQMCQSQFKMITLSSANWKLSFMSQWRHFC